MYRLQRDSAGRTIRQAVSLRKKIMKRVGGVTYFHDPKGELVREAEALHERVIDPETGRVRLFPALFWQGLDYQVFRIWCHQTARYGIPTVELVNWLKERIDGRKAIEIGSGNGDLGYHLGIPETDSYCQTRVPWIALAYASSGQVPTRPSESVREMDAFDAVAFQKPDIVIASWVTHQSSSGTGFTVGVDESSIIELADYIVVGNLAVHADKPILELPHEEFSFPWIVSRASDPRLDRVWSWRRKA